jgi:hypothetical protein
LRDGGACAVGDRDEALAAALALEDQEGLVGAEGVARQRDQLGGAQAGAVEQLDQRRQAQRQRTRLRPLAALDFGEQGVDGGVVEHPGQRPGAGGSGQSGGGVVGAQALVLEEGVEAAQRGRLAGDGGALERQPGGRQRLQPVRRSGGETAAEQLRRAAQVPAVGEQGVGGGARLRRHHLEEGADQPPVLARGAHSRVIASAAIIRAS